MPATSIPAAIAIILARSYTLLSENTVLVIDRIIKKIFVCRCSVFSVEFSRIFDQKMGNFPPSARSWPFIFVSSFLPVLQGNARWWTIFYREDQSSTFVIFFWKRWAFGHAHIHRDSVVLKMTACGRSNLYHWYSFIAKVC